MRLKALEKEGLIECAEEKRSPMMVLWRLTEKDKDTLPFLMQLTAFGSKWYSNVVFHDKIPRKLNEIFTQPEARKLIGVSAEGIPIVNNPQIQSCIDMKEVSTLV